MITKFVNIFTLSWSVVQKHTQSWGELSKASVLLLFCLLFLLCLKWM